MLDHLRQKAAQALACARSVILSSYGPADIQTSRLACAADGLTLYVFIPRSSDHLLNLEHRAGVVVSANSWELHGSARVLSADEIPAAPRHPEPDANSPVGCVVAILPTRLTIHAQTGQGNSETIDF